MSKEVNFCNILKPRNTQCGIFKFMSRAWNPQRTLVLDRTYSPQNLKDLVAQSVYLDQVIEVESAKSGKSKIKLKQEVLAYLEEIGFEKKLHVIRWMGIVFLKICFMMKIGVYVNEPAVLKLKSTMGKNPVLFLPTHRSYADFCLMTYLCYHYDIDFPAVAAGMDFYSMAVVGRAMRETCAFFIRRSLTGAPLYAAALRQYVRTVVARHCAPVEFFLEGTRSRSNKSLPPKYGMLSMSLVPLFSREVTDVTIVPVNISYDRLMEQKLFAYEHIGVPKPKESTGGFLKSLRSLNDHFGNIYINLGEPISAEDYLKHETNTLETTKPIDLQQLTPEQFTIVQQIAGDVIAKQQQSTVATISNLVALVLMQSLLDNRALELDQVELEVEWMAGVLRGLGASVYETDVRGDVTRILVVHSQMMRVDSGSRLRLLAGDVMELSNDVKRKMKGHILATCTIATAIPVIQLQLYINPVMHYLVPPALLCVVIHNAAVTTEVLRERYRRLRKLLHHEFFHQDKTEDETLSQAMLYIESSGAATRAVDGTWGPAVGLGIPKGGDLETTGARLSGLLRASVWPALTTLLNCADVLIQNNESEHKQVLRLVQEKAEREKHHPYCLSLDAISNCLQGLVLAGALTKKRCDQEVSYQTMAGVMAECREFVASVLPSFDVNFDENNKVILLEKLVSRL